MKKLLLLLILLVFTIPMMGQPTQIAIDAKDKALDEMEQVTQEYVTTTNVEKLVDKYSMKIEAAIISLATTLQQPAEYVYEILVKQQRIKAYSNSIAILLAIIFSICSFTYMGNIKDWEYLESYQGKEGSGIKFIISTMLAAIFIIWSTIAINMIFTGIFNPEYGAITEISNLIT